MNEKVKTREEDRVLSHNLIVLRDPFLFCTKTLLTHVICLSVCL